MKFLLLPLSVLLMGCIILNNLFIELNSIKISSTSVYFNSTIVYPILRVAAFGTGYA